MLALTIVSVLLAVVGAVPIHNTTALPAADFNIGVMSTLNDNTITFLNTSGPNGPSSQLPLVERGIIPVSKVGCWKKVTLDPEEIEHAIEKLKAWGSKTLIRVGSWHGEDVGLAGAWVCNCKHFVKDHIVDEELDEAFELMHDKCGLDGAGWVWSRRWQKSISFGTSKLMRWVTEGNNHCPPLCLWNPYEEPDHY